MASRHLQVSDDSDASRSLPQTTNTQVMCGAGSMSSNTSERLSESGSHCIETLDFLRDPFVASLIETHPNRLVAASSSSSSSSSSLPRDIEWLDWCDSPIAPNLDAETSVDSDSDSGSGQKKQKQWETIVQAYIDSDARDGGVTCAEVRTCFSLVSERLNGVHYFFFV